MTVTEQLLDEMATLIESGGRSSTDIGLDTHIIVASSGTWSGSTEVPLIHKPCILRGAWQDVAGITCISKTGRLANTFPEGSGVQFAGASEGVCIVLWSSSQAPVQCNEIINVNDHLYISTVNASARIYLLIADIVSAG